MHTAFKIVSQAGPAPLLFGMTIEQAERFVGRPSIVHKNNLNELNAQYESFSVRYSQKSQRLVEVGFGPGTDLEVYGLRPFEQPDAWIELLKQDKSPHECLGFIVLLNLGLTLTGFHDNDLSQRAITAFPLGRWDDFRTKSAAKFKPYPIPRD